MMIKRHTIADEYGDHFVLALGYGKATVVWAGNVAKHPDIFTHWRPIGPMPTEGETK